MSKPVLIKRFQQDHVLVNDKVLYNTNNHYTEDGIERPADYFEKIRMGATKNWIDKFHGNNYSKMTLDEQDLAWMKKAFITCACTGRFSHIYDDELEETCKKYKMPECETTTGYFIRTDNVSLKEGMYGAGPYNSIENVIKSMVSCRGGHACFAPEDISCDVYFMKWLDVNPDKEFRIFVFQNKITAISAQHLYTINKWLDSLTDQEIDAVVNKIQLFFEHNIREKMAYMSDYTMDFALLGEEETPYFIEANSFGRYYAAGSSLFQWIIDNDTLHGLTDFIEFRYTSKRGCEFTYGKHTTSNQLENTTMAAVT